MFEHRAQAPSRPHVLIRWMYRKVLQKGFYQTCEGTIRNADGTRNRVVLYFVGETEIKTIHGLKEVIKERRQYPDLFKPDRYSGIEIYKSHIYIPFWSRRSK